ncbi:zinc finger protein 62-like isoform X2 [Ochlerotatus camptorhynchus]|uniref:zinc finger protein 62-like isoform X2 n=1 Tax=Ochlerotatus camptorhynchus TaxID=644619 RepID=UPI0031DACB19
MVEHFTSVCRLCMIKEGSLEDIFRCEDLNVWILDFLSIVVSKDDKISLSICTGCRRRLHEFREYQLRCLEVQDVLLRKSIAVEEGDLSFVESEDLQQHTADVHGEHQTTVADAPVIRKQSRFCRQKSESSSNKVTCTTCTKKVFQYRLEGHQNRHQGLRPFKCERGCENVDFNCRYNRQHHYRNVHDGEQHECDVCHKTFRNKACLYYHIKGVHAPKTFECPVCNKGFSTSSRLLAHKKRHSIRERKYPCSLCSLSFFTKYILQIHMKTHRRVNARGQKQTLVDADQAVENPERMQADTSLTIGEDKFAEKEVKIKPDPEQSNDGKDCSIPDEEKQLCSVCDKIFPKVRMEGHQNWHQGLQPFECERGCEDVDFHCQQKRLQHYRKVHDRHECDICHNFFRSKKTLRTHKQGVHAAKTFECSVCNQKFTTSARLKIHTKFVHDREKNHACQKCSKLFCFKYELNRHLKSHGKEEGRRQANRQIVVMETLVKLEPGADSKQLQDDMHDDFSSMAMEEVEKIDVNVRKTVEKLECQKCDKKILETGMEAHLNWHEGLRPYKCERGCDGEGFRSDQLRQNHYRIVHEKNGCDICHKTFRCKQNLNSHKRSVHGAKTFTCFCGKAFTINFNFRYRLERHIDQVHKGDKDQCCPMCSKAFTRKHDMIKHMEIHKKNEQDEEPAEFEDLFEAEAVKVETRDDIDDDSIISIKEEINPTDAAIQKTTES